MPQDSIFSELRKRKVVQVAAIYGAVAWGVTEVIVTISEQLFLPHWISTLAVIFFVLGFPVSMFLAWTFDITADGIRRTTVASKRGATSIAASMVLLVAGTAGLFFLIKPYPQVCGPGRAAMGITPNSVAVLPFADAGVKVEEAYVVEGLGDELRDQLIRTTGMHVAARSSSIAAVERGLDAVDISCTLGVANLVEGNVRRRNNLLAVSVQLIEGGSGLVAWSQTFERGPRELLNVQQAIADAIVSHVLPNAKQAAADPVTRDPTANELMWLAREYEQQVRERQDVDVETLLESIRLYRKAVEIDRDSGLAQSRLAGALIYLGDLDAAREPIFRALVLAPELSEVQNTLGEWYWARGQVRDAGAAWARAIELNPENSEALPNYALWLWKQLEVDQAKETYRRALEADRLVLDGYLQYGSFLALQGYWDEARDLVQQVEELFKGAAADRDIGELWSYLGEVDKAIAWTIRARNLEPGNSSHVYQLAEYYADIGDFETALKLDPDGIGILWKMRRYEKMIPLAEEAWIDQPDDLRNLSILAIAYNATKRYQDAIRALSPFDLPGAMHDGARSTEEVDAFEAMMNALYGAGEVDAARELARISVDFGKWDTNYWWINVPAACELIILDRDDEARQSLEKAGKGLVLAWDPILKDSPCFDEFKDNPVYRATVQYYDERRATLRNRLPITLARFGVKL
jgi:TolB-like protein/tetratricopeptide (TPR) repeat protein